MYYVKKDGYSIVPNIRLSFIKDLFRDASFKKILSQYTPLVLAALFLSLALPANNMIAASLTSGSVAAYNVGGKFILFFTGLISTGISTVLLPYFAHYFAGDDVVAVRKELSFFLMLATIAAIPVTIILFVLTPFLVKLIFRGAMFSGSDITTVAQIMRYGIIQISFFCANMILVKFANAKRKNTLVTISSFLGLIMNIVLSLIFIRYMGVAGIALASSLAMFMATMLLIVVGYIYGDINRPDFMLIIVTWVLFLVIFLYYYYDNLIGIVFTSLPLIMAVIFYFMKLTGKSQDMAIKMKGSF
jgi:putative peptidoglycan lipid II flippase